jgi:phenylacetic acid degradation operon negative regulatory protein
VKPRTEELLYLLLWGADQLARPSFRNLTDSFENWAYRNGFVRQLQDLEARQILERQPSGAVEAIYRLSESGRLIALGGRDPVAQWKRHWDGLWRMVVFDLPETKSAARKKLRRFLKDSGFGYLQNSVWISPDPLSEITQELSERAKDVESLVTLEARPAASETDAEIVAGAWDFTRINQRYERCLRVFGQLPQVRAKEDGPARDLRRWAQQEKAAWHEAISADPLLPDQLLPASYLGKKVWQERMRTLTAAARLIR